MTYYDITGMSCAACSSRVERAVLKLEGVESVSVNLLTETLGIEGNVPSEAVIEAVTKAGYGASIKSSSVNKSEMSKKTGNVQNETDLSNASRFDSMKVRLISSVVFLAVLMYFSMGYSMFGFWLPVFFDDNYIAIGLVQLILATIVMIINKHFFINGFMGLIRRAPNMDTLVALGSSASFLYSLYALFLMTGKQVAGDVYGAHALLHEMYFESAAMILVLITVGKMLEARSKGKTTSALKGLMKLFPKTAVVIRDGCEINVAVEEVVKGDIFVVRPGETVPVDGVVIDGISSVNEAALTGESIPVDKKAGDSVSAATINQYGVIKCKALRVGEDTTLAQIVQLVSDAAATKAPIAKVADKVSGIFVPVVILIAVITAMIWLAVGETIGFSVARGISVLVISCPCALGLATPVAIMVGNGIGAKRGILYKTAAALEHMGRVKIVAFDKTGTITKGCPKVVDVIPAKGISEEELLEMAYALEYNSEHPLAAAIRDEAEERKLNLLTAEELRVLPGKGLTAVIKDCEADKAEPEEVKSNILCGGSYDYISSVVNLDSEIKEITDKLSAEGKTLLLFGNNENYIGMIAVADTIKEDSALAITELKNMGIKVVMLTGDNINTAKAIGRKVGIEEVIAGVMPEEKENVIRKLKNKGITAMVGDGINDAPALVRADMGIAIGAGTDIAIDAADVVLVNNSLTDVPTAIRLSKKVLRNIHENLFWAFFYNMACIPLAAGAFIPLFGWQLNPMVGAAAMSLSSFCVVSNALRLNRFKSDKNVQQNTEMNEKEIIIKDEKQNDIVNSKNNESEEKKIMEKTIMIEGMMCGHCEARVKKILESMEEVDKADVSHEKGAATVVLNSPVSDEKLIKIIEEQDYRVVGID